MADPTPTSFVTQALAALALLAGGGGLVGGTSRWRRRRNGRSDADKIVAALKEEGDATRKVQHECHKELIAEMKAVRSDTRVLLDREERG